MIVDTLTLEITGLDPNDLPLESFAKAISGMAGLLSSLDKGKTLDWRVSKISMSSPCHMTTTAEPKKEKFNRGVADAANRTLRDLNAHRTPKGVNKTALKYAKSIIKVLSDRIAKMSIKSPEVGLVELKKMKQSESKGGIQEVQQEREYRADVELVGVLETATTALGGEVFFVRDVLTNRRTECTVPRELFNKALEAMKREKPRVAVSGRTRYVGGYPFAMQVEKFEVWPTLDEHPGLFAVQGIDIAGGMDAAEYVRSIRGD